MRALVTVGSLATLVCLILAPVSAAVAQRVEFQLFAGSAVSLPLPVSIVQEGEPDLHFTAHWATRPTAPAPYYAGRLGLWSGRRGWRLDFTHHKLYLTNPPPEIDRFQITHGFNMLTVSRTFRSGHTSYGIGTGPVFTYPYNTVRGKKLDHDRGLGGYLLSGATVLAEVTREFPLVAGLVLSLDARGSASFVRVPVVGGHASVPNAALHLHAGIGYLFGRRR